MKKGRTKEFSLAYEVNKLRKFLPLPITNIVFDERYEYGKRYLDDEINHTIIYAKLFINDEMIGTIPYMSDRWGLMYDTNKEDELSWDKIYGQFRDVIFNKILLQQPNAATVEIRKYLSLYIKDKDGALINTALCNYINGEWNVVVAGPNLVEKVKVTKVTIQAPPPPKNIVR